VCVREGERAKCIIHKLSRNPTNPDCKHCEGYVGAHLLRKRSKNICKVNNNNMLRKCY